MSAPFNDWDEDNAWRILSYSNPLAWMMLQARDERERRIFADFPHVDFDDGPASEDFETAFARAQVDLQHIGANHGPVQS